jgi:predicted rRNA methylase YqxC with S4 and FtsJ domains
LVVFLIKPQFEIQGNKNKQGKIVNDEMIFEKIAEIKELIKNNGYQIADFVESPILGKKGGNKEYLLYARKI